MRELETNWMCSRQGAENLYKATSNKKLKETINLELSFMNSTLQLLKEQLSELNSAVDVYQHEKYANSLSSSNRWCLIEFSMLKAWRIFANGSPWIERDQRHRLLWAVLGLYFGTLLRRPVKLRRCHTRSDRHETGEGCLQCLFGAHGFIDGWLFKATRTPTRDENGVDLLCKYYNLLYYAERRFFPADRNIGLYFEWYDSLTGRQQWDDSSHSRVSVTQIADKHMALQFRQPFKVFCANYFFKVSRRVKKLLHWRKHQLCSTLPHSTRKSARRKIARNSANSMELAIRFWKRQEFSNTSSVSFGERNHNRNQDADYGSCKCVQLAFDYRWKSNYSRTC